MRNRVNWEDKEMPPISSVTNADKSITSTCMKCHHASLADMYEIPSRFTCRHDLVAGTIH